MRFTNRQVSLVFKPSLTPNLVVGMKWLLSTYTSCFNRRHKFFGHLFSGRYKSLIVDGSGSGYLKKSGRLRPFESGASETGGGGCALEEFCLEQLAGLLARCPRAQNARRGCGWIGCWASGACPRTVRRGGNGLSRR